MLSQKQKIYLMFAPVILLLFGVIIFTLDVKNPDIERHECKVLASGRAANVYRTGQNLLYTSSGRKVHDVALACPKLKTVVLNDFDVFVAEIAPGDPARLTHRTYHVLPERWAVDIHHKADPKKKDAPAKTSVIPLSVDQF